MKDYYRILGVPDNADIYDIKSAYRRLAKLYHPDLNPGSRHSEEKFKEILDAYTILSDPDLRAQYDRKRNLGFRAEFRPSAKPGESEKEKKKDPGRKEYPPEYIERLRQRNRSRIVKQIQRRKKILRGMIITFALYLVGTAIFESWLSRKNEKETAEMNRRIAEMHERDSLINIRDGIRNLDSPYDSIFGAGISTWLSPNQLVVINPITDAVVCIVQNGPPHRTIRNEFIHAYQSFIMKEIPNGNYSVKVYIGDNWKDSLTVPDGRALGRFSMNEQFFRIDRDPIILTKPTYENPHTVTTDTIRIDPDRMKFVQISRDAFFDKGE